MSDILNHLGLGFGVAFSPINLLVAAIGSFLGTIVGVLPGLGPINGVAMLVPICFAMGLPPDTALILLAAVYVGAEYGGRITSILLNVPGEAASVMTTLDAVSYTHLDVYKRQALYRPSGPVAATSVHIRRPSMIRFSPFLAATAFAALVAGTAQAEPAKPECIAPAQPGGGFDLTCRLAVNAFKNTGVLKEAMRTVYMPGGIGAVAYNNVITQRPGEPGTIIAFSGGSLLNLSLIHI